jgi:hypothetical protein
MLKNGRRRRQMQDREKRVPRFKTIDGIEED